MIENKDRIAYSNEDDADRRIRVLDAIIDTELKKDINEIDVDLIDESVDLGLLLKDISVELTQNELKKKSQEILALSKRQDKQCHRFNRKKLISLIAVAAIMISILSVSINSEWSPFKLFVDNIWDIFDMKPGNVISNENQDFIKLESATYDSIEKLVSNTGYNILCLKNAEPETVEFINVPNQEICIRYKDDRIISVYLTNAPYNRDSISTSEDIEHIEVKGRMLHQSRIFDNLIQAVLFDGDYVYVLTAKNEELLHKMAEDLIYAKETK